MEGGGFRGCYTAGALKWLNDHDIHFPYVVTISAASIYGYGYLIGDDQLSYDLSVMAVKDPNFVGLLPFLKKGVLVDYHYLNEHYFIERYLETYGRLLKPDVRLEIGLFNMDKSQLEYFSQDDFDDKATILEGSLVLPVSNHMTRINGDHYLDGGIRHMVSINRSLQTGHDRNLVIVTKDKNYVRKPNGVLLTALLKLMYHKYPGMLKTLDGRVASYYAEMDQIYELENKKEAILIRPSRDTGVKRFTGSHQQLDDMYWLGYQDMEDRKAELFAFLEVEK